MELLLLGTSASPFLRADMSSRQVSGTARVRILYLCYPDSLPFSERASCNALTQTTGSLPECAIGIGV